MHKINHNHTEAYNYYFYYLRGYEPENNSEAESGIIPYDHWMPDPSGGINVFTLSACCHFNLHLKDQIN